jgi:signal transduction histidine kinase
LIFDATKTPSAGREDPPFLVFLCFCLALFAATWFLTNNNGKVPPKAVGGLIDLREWDFATDGPIALNGEWEFDWNVHLDPADSPAGSPAKPKTLIRVPGSWNGRWIEGRKISGSGFATYKLKVLLRPPNVLLGFKFLDMSSAFSFYINGELLTMEGVPGSSAAVSSPRYNPHVVPFDYNGDEMAIVCHVSNFSHRQGGFWEPVMLGSFDQVENIRERRIDVNLFLIGSIVVMGMFHFGLFAMRRNEKSLLLFGVFCFLIAARTLVTGERYLVGVFPGLGWNILLKIEYLTIYFSIPVFALFCKHVFPEEFSDRIFRPLFGIVFLFTAAVIFLPPRLYSYTLPVFQILILALFAYGFAAVIVAIYRKREGAVIFFIGFTLLVLAATNDVLYAQSLIHTGYITPYGLFLFVLFQSMLIAQQYSRSFEMLNVQRTDLVNANSAYRKEIRLREQIEEALRIEHQNLETITRNIGVGLAVISKDYKIIWANEVLRDMFGEDEATPCFTLYNQREDVCPDCGVKQVFENGEDFVVHEQKGMDAAGNEIWSELIATPIRDTHGRLLAALELVIPITARKQQERKKETLEARLQQAQKMEALGTLAGGVAHEFNNALGVILMNLDVLDLHLKGEERKFIRPMRLSSERMAQLTNLLLAYARGGKYSPSAISVIDLIQDTVALAKENVRPSVEIQVHEMEKDLFALADPNQFQLVLLAILNNASEAMTTGGKIRVQCVKVDLTAEDEADFPSLTPGAHICISVEDEGKGMKEGERGKIFEPFFSTKQHGRGLSMAAVYGIVKNHNGWIFVDSIFGEGTTVRLYLPLCEEPFSGNRDPHADPGQPVP